MIKEIVNLGKVVNSKASVFTMKVDDTRYVRVDIDDEIKISLDSVINYEEFLEYGLFRERISNKIILFPLSFVIEIDKGNIKTNLSFFKNGLEKLNSSIFEKIYKIIEQNFETITQKVLEILDDKNNKKVAVVIFYKNKAVYEYDDIFEKLKDFKISIYFNEYKEGICNVLGIKDKLYYPKANFYYPFSIDKKIVRFNLKDEKNLFLVSKRAIEYFFAGKEYLEKFNRYKILGNFVFITASSFEEDNLKEFEKFLIRDNEKSFNSLISIFNRSGAKFKEKILINFYFHTSPAQGSKEIVRYLKDVMPTYLVKLDKSYKNLQKDFYVEVKYYWSRILSSIFDEEKDKRALIDIFSKIVKNEKIDFKFILKKVNQKSEKDRFYLSFYLFLIWLKGEKVENIQGKSYEDRLNFVLNNFELVKNSNSAKAGVCVGLILKMLSFSINDFDKKILSFVSKKLGRDKKSLLKFVNPLFERAKLHQNSYKQDINIKYAIEIIANLKDFDKEEFIFGMFLGNEIYNLLKGESDE